MPAQYEIRANFDSETLVVYQAYAPSIAQPALEHQRFVAPFSFQRMTWIKPSFLWLMHRSRWGSKRGQEKTLAIHVLRQGFDEALRLGVLTHPEPSVYPDPDAWEAKFRDAKVHIQWDTERSLRGADLNYFSLQVGISRHLIRRYVDEWVVKIEDYSPRVTKMRELIRKGSEKQARRMLPVERVYSVDSETAARILIGGDVHR